MADAVQGLVIRINTAYWKTARIKIQSNNEGNFYVESNNQDIHKSMKIKQLLATLGGLRFTIKNHGLLQSEIKHYLNILIPGMSVLTDGMAYNAINNDWQCTAAICIYTKTAKL